MRYPPINNAFFSRNRLNISQLLPETSLAVVNSADAMIRNGDQCYPFRQQSDLFYLTGIEQEGSILLMAPGHYTPAAREVLFILDPDPAYEERFGVRLSKEEASNLSGIQNIQWISAFDAWFHRMMVESESLFLNIYEYPKFSTEVPSRDHRFAQMVNQRYPCHQKERLGPLMTKLRMRKDEIEIKLIRHAIEVTGKAFQRVAKYLKPGMREFQIEAEILHECMINACQGTAYLPIIASGENACVLHYTSNNDILKDGDLVLMDFGAEYANYAADLSRTLPINGRFNPRQRQLYDAVHKVMKDIQLHFVPGNTIDQLNKKARLMMAEELIRLGILDGKRIKDEQQAAKAALKYMVHGITHHIGLDVHDLVDPATVLQEGMVMSCEPGLYIPEEGLGIRIENNILVHKSPIDLMANIPSEASELEALMASN